MSPQHRIEPLRRLARGAARRLNVALDVLRARRFPDFTSDDLFLDHVYSALFGREADAAGKSYYARRLREGESRTNVVIELTRSDEFARRAAAKITRLPSLVALRPDRYETEEDALDGRRFLTYNVRSTEDFDWLEARISEFRYYERPGVWSMDVNLDKRVMAELISLFRPNSVLEIGCSNGAVMQCLVDLGVLDVHGVDISEASRDSARPDVRDRIHVVDLGSDALGRTFDLVYGLDVFEHINPNRLDAFLARTVEHVQPGGWFITNTPAFGADPVFGTVLPLYVPAWFEDAASEGIFRRLEVDADGYPVNGHLVWATADWWHARFESAGLIRAPAVERALHARYDDYFDATSKARKAIFVYWKAPEPDWSTVITSIESRPSPCLEEFAAL